MKIQEQSLLARVSIKKWSNAKTDKNLTDEVAESKNANPDLIRVRKTLINAPVVKELTKLAGRVRNNIVGKLTIPWNEDGTRLLPVELIDRFEKELSDAKDRWGELTEELGDTYDTYIERAEHDLGDAFDATDYPSREDILSRYSIDVDYTPLPTGGDLRVSLPQDKLDKLREDVERQVQSKVEDAMETVHKRVVDTLNHLVDKLRAFGVDAKTGKAIGVFRDSTVENLNDLVEILAVLNVTGDPRLTAASNDLLTQLRDLDPEALRQSEGHRKDVAEKAQSIVDDLTGFYD